MSPHESTLPRAQRLLRRLARFVLILVALVFFVVVAVGVGAYLVFEAATSPGVPGANVDFQVPSGASGAEIGELLAEAGLIEHPALFRVALRIGVDGTVHLKHGPYSVRQGMSPVEIKRLFQHGPNRALTPAEIPDALRVTIPEGLRITQMADLFDDPDAFLEAALDPELLERIGTGQTVPEGFLMPDTYYFDAEPTEAEVVLRMLEQFETVFGKLLDALPEAPSRSTLEIVTIASLIEEEARVDEERPLIAAVIYNRLERGRKLEFDSTLQYALNKYGQRLLSEDKEVDSAYNTYRNTGLPPGPISSPGAMSLDAALNPADVDYLYFVSNGDGETHTFSRTLAEHNEAVRRYRRDMRKQRKAATQPVPE